jgi:hypothetical protein
MEFEFVPYKLSLRLKEIGFDWPCYKYIYTGDTGNNVDHYSEVRASDSKNWNGSSDLCISQPTYSLAFRWLRKKHNLFPEILTDCTTYPKFCYTYTRFFGNPRDLTAGEWGWENTAGNYSLLYTSYEEAEFYCLDEMIGIIEKLKEENARLGKTK